jgi:hypothetical protein
MIPSISCHFSIPIVLLLLWSFSLENTCHM